ncbi:MAG: choice-of-anchor tandem repeat GloVer-containing protein [Terriglobales bacterium]
MSDTRWPWKRSLWKGMAGKRKVRGLVMLAAVLGMLFSAAQSARAQNLKFLYNFTGGADGNGPDAGLVGDGDGNFYGTTWGGGAYGWGTVYKVTNKGVETVLYNFTNGADGAYPADALLRDKHGNLFGTTYWGGAGAGVVFKVARDGTETVLHTFGGGEGAWPVADLVLDAEGNLYGTAAELGPAGYGTVFGLTPEGALTVLHGFAGWFHGDGREPDGGVVRDAEGNLYGTTKFGGVGRCGAGCGTVFEVSPDGVETVLHTFTTAPGEGAFPVADLVMDGEGNLYGTTVNGGIASGYGGHGTVFELTPEGTERVLHDFGDRPDGRWPLGGLVMDAQGNLYGTTYAGGAYGGGTVFEITPAGAEIVLYNFTKKKPGGYHPWSRLVWDKRGRLYGTTQSGGTYGAGTVFRLTF